MSRANKNHPYDQDHLTGDGSPNSPPSNRPSNAVVVDPHSSSTPPPKLPPHPLPASASRVRVFFRKYFLDGQRFDSGLEARARKKCVCDQSPLSSAIPFQERHRKFIAFVIPFVIAQVSRLARNRVSTVLDVPNSDSTILNKAQ